MKIVRSVMLLAAAALLLITTSVAATDVPSYTLKFGDGLGTLLLYQAGCSLKWTAPVMGYNGIEPKDLHRLPVGKEIKIPFDCSVDPPTAATALSMRILTADRNGTLGIETAELQKEITALRDKKASLEDSLEKEQAASESAFRKLQAAETQIAELKKEVAALHGGDRSSDTVFGLSKRNAGFACIGLALVFLFVGMYVGIRRGRNERREHFLPTHLPAVVKGKTFLCPVTTITQTNDGWDYRVHCPFCPENNLKLINVPEHLLGRHKEEVLVSERPLAFARGA